MECSHTTAAGAPCKGRVVAGSDPPACASHLKLAGRKSSLTPELAQQIVAALRAGNHTNVVLAALGVPRRTFYDWLERGAAEGEDEAAAEYRDFRVAVEGARAYGEMRNITSIARAAAKDWRAAAWLEQNLSPERWGKKRGAVDDAAGDEKPAAAGPADPFADDPSDELSARRAASRSA